METIMEEVMEVTMGMIPDSNNVWKYILGTLVALGIGGGIYLWNKNKKKQEVKNDITN